MLTSTMRSTWPWAPPRVPGRSHAANAIAQEQASRTSTKAERPHLIRSPPPTPSKSASLLGGRAGIELALAYTSAMAHVASAVELLRWSEDPAASEARSVLFCEPVVLVHLGAEPPPDAQGAPSWQGLAELPAPTVGVATA